MVKQFCVSETSAYLIGSLEKLNLQNVWHNINLFGREKEEGPGLNWTPSLIYLVHVYVWLNANAVFIYCIIFANVKKKKEKKKSIYLIYW